jgi:putative endonuclease
MTKSTNAFGEMGERIAARWLEQQGYSVLARRWRSGHRDVDVIAARDGVIAFVEVKTRAALEFGDPVEAVNAQKRRSLVRSAREWMERHDARERQNRSSSTDNSTTRSLGPDLAFRFDVVGVLLRERRVWIRHIKGAFTV